MTISPELTAIYVSAPIDDRLLDTLEISHPNFTQTFYLTNSGETFVAKDENGVDRTFQQFPFEIVLPPSSDSGFEDLNIVISNVTRVLIDQIELANQNVKVPIQIVYRGYAASNLTVPGIVLPALSSTEVVVDQQVITARASLIDLVNRDFPNELYTPTNFPMLGYIT